MNKRIMVIALTSALALLSVSAFAGVDEDTFQKYKLQAEAGDAESQFQLGWIYEVGRGIKIDNQQAYQWYLASAEQGNEKAQRNISVMLEKGTGIKRNLIEADKWNLRAAENGESHAQGALSAQYYYGERVEKSCDKTIYWLTKSANQGEAVSQGNLGFLNMKGLCLGMNPSKAVEWYRKAADHDDVSSNEGKLGLAEAYFNGNGVTLNYVIAAAIYKSIHEGNNADFVAEKLTEQDLAQADALVKELTKPGNFLKAIDSYEERLY